MNEIAITVITSAATLIGTVIAVLSGNKLTAYRIEQLENRVREHNNVIKRTYELEKRADVFENRMKVSEHRLDDIEQEEKRHE